MIIRRQSSAVDREHHATTVANISITPISQNRTIMDYEDLTPEQKEIWDIAYEEGYDSGFDSGQDFGWDEAVSQQQNDEYDTGYHNGYQAGIEAEQDRIQAVLGMMFESALNMGQGNKAVQYKHSMDLLKPVEIKPMVDDDY